MVFDGSMPSMMEIVSPKFSSLRSSSSSLVWLRESLDPALDPARLVEAMLNCLKRIAKVQNTKLGAAKLTIDVFRAHRESEMTFCPSCFDRDTKPCPWTPGCKALSGASSFGCVVLWSVEQTNVALNTLVEQQIPYHFSFSSSFRPIRRLQIFSIGKIKRSQVT